MQFFISPLCAESSLEREVQAVDSEFAGVVQDDGCRAVQLMCHTVSAGPVPLNVERGVTRIYALCTHVHTCLAACVHRLHDCGPTMIGARAQAQLGSVDMSQSWLSCPGAIESSSFHFPRTCCIRGSRRPNLAMCTGSSLGATS